MYQNGRVLFGKHVVVGRIVNGRSARAFRGRSFGRLHHRFLFNGSVRLERFLGHRSRCKGQ